MPLFLEDLSPRLEFIKMFDYSPVPANPISPLKLIYGKFGQIFISDVIKYRRGVKTHLGTQVVMVIHTRIKQTL